jgi:hypothetical protein
MSSRAVGGDEAGTTATANHQGRDQTVDRKPAVAPEPSAMRFIAAHTVVPLVQQSPVVGPNVLKANLLVGFLSCVLPFVIEISIKAILMLYCCCWLGSMKGNCGFFSLTRDIQT